MTICWLFFSLCLYHFPSSPSLPSQSAWYFFFHSVEFPQLFRLLKFYLEIVTGKTMLFHVLAMAEVLCANCLSYSFQEKAQTGSANTNTRNIKSISPKWVFLCVCVRVPCRCTCWIWDSNSTCSPPIPPLGFMTDRRQQYLPTMQQIPSSSLYELWVNMSGITFFRSAKLLAERQTAASLPNNWS